MFEFSRYIDLRVLWVLSPITTALAWAMLICDEPGFQDNEPWWY